MQDALTNPPPDTPLLRRIRAGVIGDDLVMDTPFGPRRMIYADYTAVGTAPSPSSRTSSATKCCRRTRTPTPSPAAPGCRRPGCARTPARSSPSRWAPTTSSSSSSRPGSTGAIDKSSAVLGLRLPSALEDRYQLDQHIPADRRPVVFIGPFEHHSNELPWRESIADVVVIGEDANGHIDHAELREQLERCRPVH